MNLEQVQIQECVQRELERSINEDWKYSKRLINVFKTEREREREMYIRCCDCLRESKSSTLIRVLNSRETSAEAALIAFFSVCSISISPPTHDQRERDASDEMKLWAIYKGLHIFGLFIWVDLTRPNNLDNIGTRRWAFFFFLFFFF